MPDLMEQAIDALKEVSPDRRDQIAWAVLELLEAPWPVALSDEDKAAIEEAEAEIERSGTATDEEVRAFWAKHGR